MRTVYILLAFLLVHTASWAQRNRSSLSDAYILKGTYLIGGDVSTSFKGFSSDRGPTQMNVDKGSIFRISLNAKSGYFVLEDFALGLNARLEHFNTNGDTTNAGPEETNLIFGPFARYYFGGLFAEIGTGFGLYNITNGQQSDLFDANAGLGYTYFLNDKIAIEPLLLFRYSKQKFAAGRDNSSYGPEFRIGIQAYLFRTRQTLPKP